jgi:rhodanese-related sulfurtransferase
MASKNITPKELYERVRAGERVNLIDVRSPREYEEVHAVGARCVPLDTLTKAANPAEVSGGAGQPVYVICRSGGRSQAACACLAGQGVDAVNVEGGTLAWDRAGLPVERGGGGGLGNWVRVGGLAAVAVGIVLGMLVSPYFFIAAAGLWVAMAVTGNAPCCCSSGSCSPTRET